MKDPKRSKGKGEMAARPRSHSSPKPSSSAWRHCRFREPVRHVLPLPAHCALGEHQQEETQYPCNNGRLICYVFDNQDPPLKGRAHPSQPPALSTAMRGILLKSHASTCELSAGQICTAEGFFFLQRLTQLRAQKFSASFLQANTIIKVKKLNSLCCVGIY